MHGDIYKNPLVLLEMIHKGQMHRGKDVVSSGLMHPLILETDWWGFNDLFGSMWGCVHDL